MFNILKTTFKIDVAYATNAFIYNIKKLPILRDLISDNLYNSSSFKAFVRFLGIFLTSARLILSRLLYFFVIYFLAALVSNDMVFSFSYVYVVFAVIGLIINNNLLNVSSKKYFSIVLFQMDAKEYMRCDFIFGLLVSFILNLVGFFFISLFINIPVLLALVLAIFSCLCRIVGEGISIAFYKKKGYLLTSNSTFLYGYLIVMLVSVFLPRFLVNIPVLIFEILFVVMAILALGFLGYIFSIKDYKLIYKKINTMRQAMNEKNASAYNRQAMVDIKDKDKTIDNKKLIGKSGYDLFNTIFFERHKEILLRSAKNFGLVSFLVIGVLIILTIVNKDVSLMISNMLENNLGYLVIIMYFINRGSIVTQAMFYNCDHAMLTYNFYREPRVLLKLFEKRLWMVVKINLIPALVIAIGIIFLLYFSSGAGLINYITIPLFIILLSVFFSVHYLVIYYLLQPFNKDLEMKKPVYSLVSGLTYFIAYILTDVKVSSLIFSISGLIFTILYIVISLILVYKFAPKTFKINN